MAPPDDPAAVSTLVGGLDLRLVAVPWFSCSAAGRAGSHAAPTL